MSWGVQEKKFLGSFKGWITRGSKLRGPGNRYGNRTFEGERGLTCASFGAGLASLRFKLWNLSAGPRISNEGNTHRHHERGFPAGNRANKRECWETYRRTRTKYKVVNEQRREEDKEDGNHQDTRRRGEERCESGLMMRHRRRYQ